MIDQSLLDGATQAIEKEASKGMFKRMGIARPSSAAGGARRLRNPRAAAPKPKAPSKSPTVIDAVPEASGGALSVPGSRSLSVPKPATAAGGGGSGMIPGGNRVSIPGSGGGPGSGMSVADGDKGKGGWLRYLLGGGAAAGGAAYAASGGEDEAAPAAAAAAPAAPPPTPAAPGMMDQFSSMLGNMSPEARNALLFGTGGALAGGLYGLMSPGEETVYDEMGRPTGTKRKSRLMSALTNAAVAGGIGAGAGGLYGAYRG